MKAAVRETAPRKHREEKPLAVMFQSLEALRAAAELSEGRRALADLHRRSIVLVRRKAEASLAEAVAPGNPWVGALLPYAPLHVLLLEAVARAGGGHQRQSLGGTALHGQ